MLPQNCFDLIGAELGMILGVTDIDGSHPFSCRYSMGGPPELNRSLTDQAHGIP
jgi:hypothetical protein